MPRRASSLARSSSSLSLNRLNIAGLLCSGTGLRFESARADVDAGCAGCRERGTPDGANVGGPPKRDRATAAVDRAEVHVAEAHVNARERPLWKDALLTEKAREAVRLRETPALEL